MDVAIIDTGIWIAMFDSRDPNYRAAGDTVDVLSILHIAVPWPTAYETLRTRFVKNPTVMRAFESFLKQPNVEFIPDDNFREDAFQLAFESSIRHKRPLSMVDCLVRLMIDDRDTRVDYLATFNKRDFMDVCVRNRVEII